MRLLFENLEFLVVVAETNEIHVVVQVFEIHVQNELRRQKNDRMVF